jgi:TetR/AcrR family transcriptional regulator, lmrAB and yxaGH operons repressor
MAKDTRTRMLETTARLLQHRGYYGTALSDILQASGAPRGSLYFHFPGGKDQLVVEATRLAVEETSVYLRETLASAPDPAEGVRAFFTAAAALLVESDYSFGCPVAPVILDAPDALPELQEICRQAFEEWVGLFRAAFVAAGIPADRAAALAVLVEAAMEGLLLIARAYRDTGALLQVANELAAIVAAAVPAGHGAAPAAADMAGAGGG